jgi:hypothetical protein
MTVSPESKSSPQTRATPFNLFVVGLDEFNGRKLEGLNVKGEYAFHPLLSVEEVISRKDYDLEATIAKASGIIESYPDTIHGIIGYWDFPVSLIIPILSEKFGLRSPCFESVLKCEHKYWSRLEQRRAVPDHVPPFQSLDPFDDKAIDAIELDFPFWIKPVKSFASHLGFRVHNRPELQRAIQEIRGGIREIGNTFNQFLNYASLPTEVAEVDGNHCLIERIISGHQCTLEGFVHEGSIQIYGVVDSFRHANRSTFTRYQYPSILPTTVTSRMIELGKRVVSQIGLNNSAFNIEFFWDRRQNRLFLLEINPRISQSHGDLFEKVDGMPHHQILIDLVVGKRPMWAKGEGQFRCAAKFFFRRFRDAWVTRVPTSEEIQAIVARFPGTLIKVLVQEGMRLSELEPQEQDSYSYLCALTFMGARNASELLKQYRECERLLRFEFAE